jgi:hypothetical protein
MQEIDYNFIEIGTADHNTVVEVSGDDDYGLCIEPVKMYLESLPNKKNVKKINCAVSFDNIESSVDLYFIPPDILRENGLKKRGLRGINSIDEYHPQHISRNITHLVQIIKIPQLPISKILIDNKVKGIDLLKIDTEGGDCFILKHLLEYLRNKSKEYYPKKIIFETNYLTEKKLIEETINMFVEVGYFVESTNNHIDDGDTVLRLE